MMRSFLWLVALFVLPVMSAGGMASSASGNGNATKSLNSTWSGDEWGSPQEVVPWGLPDLPGTHSALIGPGGMPVMLLAAADGNGDEEDDEDGAKNDDEKDKDDAPGGWDRTWDSPKLG